MKTRRIAVLFQNSWLETLPFIREPIMKLENLGYEIDVFMPVSKDYPETVICGIKINIIPFDFNYNRGSLFATVFKLISYSLKRNYSMFVAVPDDSLVLGAMTASLVRKPIIAFSDEILPSRGRRRDWLLKWAYERSEFVVITDLSRIAAFELSIPKIRKLRYYELPNASSAKKVINVNNRYCSKCRVINLGWFHESFGAEIILAALPYIKKEPITFVIHERSSRNDLGKLDRMTMKLIEMAFPIEFNFAPVLYDRVDDIVDGSDIGLALYTSKDRNINLCGKGSGKLARYLKCGKPVVVSGENLRWIVEFGAGEYAERGEELYMAILKIMANYESYSERALDCYHEFFEFEKFFEPILCEIKKLDNTDEIATGVPVGSASTGDVKH